MYSLNKTLLLIGTLLSLSLKGVEETKSWTNLQTAIFGGDYSTIKKSITPTSLFKHNKFGITAVYLAALKGDSKTLQLLLKKGANSFVQNNRSLETALHQAVYSRSLSCVRILLNFSAPIGVLDKHGQTALDIAQNRNFLEIAEILEKWSPEKAIYKPLNTLLGNYSWCGYYKDSFLIF